MDKNNNGIVYEGMCVWVWVLKLWIRTRSSVHQRHSGLLRTISLALPLLCAVKRFILFLLLYNSSRSHYSGTDFISPRFLSTRIRNLSRDLCDDDFEHKVDA